MYRKALISAAILLAFGGQVRADDGKLAAGTTCSAIAEASARQIAWTNGLIHIEEIVLFGGRWEVAGRDREGFEVTIDIRACDGEVLR